MLVSKNTLCHIVVVKRPCPSTAGLAWRSLGELVTPSDGGSTQYWVWSIITIINNSKSFSYKKKILLGVKSDDKHHQFELIIASSVQLLPIVPAGVPLSQAGGSLQRPL